MLDSDLAKIYGYETKRLNEQVRRNKHKFPDDFMFQLTNIEFDNLKSQKFQPTEYMNYLETKDTPLDFSYCA